MASERLATHPFADVLRITPRKRVNPSLVDRGYAQLAQAVLKQAHTDIPTRCPAAHCDQCSEYQCSLRWLLYPSTELTLWCSVAGVSQLLVTTLARERFARLHD